ncbi:hypothetical protein Avbf_11873 [Armadillidium vulgare]|nr:hypothetical protein Avbf_11873 [Armadillidium vulgare]
MRFIEYLNDIFRYNKFYKCYRLLVTLFSSNSLDKLTLEKWRIFRHYSWNSYFVTQRELGMAILSPKLIFIILVTLLSVLLHHTSSQSKVNNDVCTVDITNMTIDQLADNPPPGLTTGCVDKNFITKIMAYKEHIHGVLDCLHPDHPVCTKKGYKFVADLYSYII